MYNKQKNEVTTIFFYKMAIYYIKCYIFDKMVIYLIKLNCNKLI